MDVTLVKEAGIVTIVGILDCVGKIEYTTEFLGVSSRYGVNDNQLAIHLDGGADDTDAVAALAAAALPTCTSSGLDITANVGTWVVDDVTSITADPTEIKTCLVSTMIDTTTAAVSIYVFEKTTGAYGDPPAGKMHCSNLKEYTLAAAGSTLAEINDYIK